MDKIKSLIFYTLFFACTACNAQKPASDVPLTVPESQIIFDNIHGNGFVSTSDYLMGKFDPAQHPDFVLIPAKYRDEEQRYIRKDVLNAFISMFDAASKEGIILKIRSATRNFESQKRIWENKWTGKTILEDNINAAKEIHDDLIRAKKILEYSSMPGTSRHHWGTDIDLNAFDNRWFEEGEGLKLYSWLLTHASQYGFCQPYTKIGSDRQTGYFEEKWHWTYLPVSIKLTEMAKISLKNEMILGFLGSETAQKIDVVKNYVISISPSCKVLKN